MTAPINSRLIVVVRSLTPFGLGRNGCWPFRGSQLPRALPFIFSLCFSLNDRRRAAHSIYKIGRLFSLFLFSCPTLALLCLLILLFLLMSGNVHPNPGPIFPCSVCAGNVTWRGKSTLSSPCSRFDSLSLSKVQLSPTLTLSSLMIWYSGQTALFLLFLARAAPAYLPTAFPVALRPLFPFRYAQYVQVFPLKPAPFCTLFAGLGSTNKSAIFLLFSSCLTLALSSPLYPLLHLSSYLKLCGRSDRNCLLFPPILSGYNGSPDTRFSRAATRLTSLPDGERHLRPPQSLVVSPLLSLVCTLVFSRTGGVLFLPSILTHRFPRFPLRNLCSLVMLAVTSLVYAATNTSFF